MRHSAIMLGFLALFGLAAVPSAEACGASFVKTVGETGHSGSTFYGNADGEHVNDIADGYLTAKNVNPSSPAGIEIRPYVIGTSLVDDLSVGAHNSYNGNIYHNLFETDSYGNVVEDSDGNPVPRDLATCISEAVACTHHAQHFNQANSQYNNLDKGVPANPTGG